MKHLNCLYIIAVQNQESWGGGRYIWYLVFYGNTFVEMYGQFKIKNFKKHCIEASRIFKIENCVSSVFANRSHNEVITMDHQKMLWSTKKNICG